MSAAGDDQAADWGVEVWRGGVNTWECDEMGHLNVRFYVAKAMEGLVGLAAALGMPQAFSAGATATLLLREHHIRFLREARPGDALHMQAAVVEMQAAEARLLLVLFHSASGEPAATFQTVVAHVTPGDGQPFAWPARALARAAAITLPVPSYAAARSIDLAAVNSQASVKRAQALGLAAIGTGAMLVQDCDVFGRMRAEQFIGRVSDGLGQVTQEVRQLAASSPAARLGGAVLEYRLVHLRWPRAGDQVALRSGLSGVDARTQRRVHWLLDPRSGEPWAVAQAINVIFDLDARKIVPVSPEALNDRLVEGLTL